MSEPPPIDPNPPAPPAPLRDANGKFITPPKVDPEVELLKAELATMKAEMAKLNPPKEEPNKPKPSKYELQYAEKLKAELGKNYNPKFDALDVGNRIDTMEAVITALKGKIEPIEKEGSNSGVGNPPPPVNTIPKSFLQQQKEKGYREKLRDRGSYAQVASKLYNTK